MTKVLFRPLILVLAALCGLLSVRPVPADTARMTRVGFLELGDYMYRGRNDEYQGLIFEFLQEVSKVGNLHFEVVDCENVARGLQMMKDGEIDLLPGVYHTPERSRIMFFPSLPLSNAFTTITVRANDARYAYDDHASFQNMRIGVVANSKSVEKLETFRSEHGLSLETVIFDTTPRMLDALAKGAVDGVCVTYLGENKRFKAVAQFSPEPFYIGVSKRQPQLLERIDAALKQITLHNPRFGSELYGKHISEELVLRPVFNKEEEVFIAHARPITVAYDPHWAPLSYQDAQTGAFSGAIAAIFDEIRRTSGLRFNFVPMPKADAMHMLNNGAIDAISCLTGNFSLDRRLRIRATRPYLRSATVRVTHEKNQGNIQRIALQAGYLLSTQVVEDIPDKAKIFRNTVRACLDDVVAGRVDAAYLNMQVAELLLANPRYGHLRSAPCPAYASDLRIGLSPHTDLRLFSVLDKCLQFLPMEQISPEENAVHVTAPDMRLQKFIRNNPLEVVVLFGSIIAVLAFGLVLKTSSNKRIAALLYRNPLTNMPNLQKFRLECAALLAAAGEREHMLLSCDIRQFKAINDQFGFATGDALLRAFGDILQRRVAHGECCAHISSDLFVLLLCYENWDRVVARVRQIDETLEEWRCSRDLPYAIATVYGAYHVQRSEYRDVQSMLDLANHARMEAKRSVHTPIVLYDAQMRQEALLHQELTGRLEQALENGEIQIWHQAKVDMRSRAIIGSEALVRWNHPTRGHIMPGSFIPLFERNGLVTSIDLHVFEQACINLRSWSLRNLPLYTVSCNFSRRHFDSPDFPQRLAAIAARYEVPTNLLELEITESAIMKNPEAAWLQLIQLKEMGFKTTIDDFGTGYSSLSLVQMLNVDIIKIDRSFIQRDLPGERAQIVLGNIIRLARDLKMSVICEGVENAEQEAIIIRLGCFKAQGYFYAKPEHEHEFAARLARQTAKTS